MAKGFDILNVKSAVKSRNKFDLSRTHLTTMDFGQIVPMCVEETIPGGDYKWDGNYFSRMMPLAKPTYGKFSFHTLSGFVPYHQIADDADAWISGKAVWEGETPKQRWISIGTLALFVVNNCCTTTGATALNSDFTIVVSGGTTNYYRFTAKGRYWVKVLNALGYALPQGVNRSTSSSWLTTEGAYKLSAYPLLAFFKLYNDYMSQSQRYNISQLTSTLRAIKHCKATTGFNPSTGEITENGLINLFNNLYLNYSTDYFTSAWQYANNPINYSQDINSIAVPGTTGNAVSNVLDDNYLLNPDFGSNYTVGQRALDFLRSFDSWVKRNHYSGSRDVQQIYSRFGIKVDDYRSNYAHILNTDIIPVQVGDVTATAQQFIAANDDHNIGLGDYAGKGIVNGSKGVSYKADDYGMLMTLGWFTVEPMNTYGFDRKVLRNQPLDYYTPEFDGIGAEAISYGEYYASPIVDPASDTTSDLSVYGFTERYNSYRYGRDLITGEFRKFRNDDDMNTWHTGRLMTDIRQNGYLVAQSSSVNTLPQSGSEYNRIFSITDDSVDHFYLTAQFNVTAILPMMNLNQVTGLGEGSTTLPRNGNVVD